MSKETELIAECQFDGWSHRMQAGTWETFVECTCGWTQSFPSTSDMVQIKRLHAAHVVSRLSEHGYSIIELPKPTPDIYGKWVVSPFYTDFVEVTPDGMVTFADVVNRFAGWSAAPHRAMVIGSAMCAAAQSVPCSGSPSCPSLHHEKACLRARPAAAEEDQ